MKNWSIGTRLSLAFGVIVAVLIGMVWLSIDRMEKTNDTLDRVVKQRLPEAAHDPCRGSGHSRKRAHHHANLPRQGQHSDGVVSRAERPEQRGQSPICSRKLEASSGNGPGKGLVPQGAENAVSHTWTAGIWRKSCCTTGKHDEAVNAMDNQVIPALTNYIRAWDAFSAYQEESMQAAAKENAAAFVDSDED